MKSLKEILDERKRLLEEKKIGGRLEQASSPLAVRLKETFALSIELNKEQILATELARSGKSFCLVGAAGTGKTTALREIVKEAAESLDGTLGSLRVQGTGEYVAVPPIAVISFTNVAANNSRKAIHKDPSLAEQLKYNITTIHNLLEFAPVFFWSDTLQKETMRFLPRRDALNQIEMQSLVIEEASMVGLDLWDKLYAAMQEGTTLIFLGDLNQLPPVFGDSILSYALTRLPVIELTQVYRQAGDSTILKNAHHILAGESLESAPDFAILPCGTVNHTQLKLAASLSVTFPKWIDSGIYDPEEDMVLCPWNKRDLGTDAMNKHIAQTLGERRRAVVYEIIAGMNKVYLAEGDKVFCNKKQGHIVKITQNSRYFGATPKAASQNLTRFGLYQAAIGEEEFLHEEDVDFSNLDLDAMIEEAENRVAEASHFVDIKIDDTGEIVTLTTMGDYSQNNLSLGYCLTVHKAQGSEWRKVFLILHRDHNVSLCRELLYTAVTRAREGFVLISKQDVVERALKTQRIKGNTVQEKIEYFNSGVALNNEVRILK